jgi:Uri superfamily endonuclease
LAKSEHSLVWVPCDRLREPGKVPASALGTATSYVLVLEVTNQLRVTIGCLGLCHLEPGCYLYVGSAKRSLAQRLKWHIRRRKKRRWHIDYLTTAKAVRVVGAFVTARWGECALRGVLEAREGCPSVLPRFGASDCTYGCVSHLLRLREGTSLWQQVKGNGEPL